MFDWPVLAAVGCLGLASYVMRVGGFFAAGLMPKNGPVQRLLRLAPGNLFVAFVAAGCLEGGVPNVAGALVALATMAVTRWQWAALISGFVAAAGARAVGS